MIDAYSKAGRNGDLKKLVNDQVKLIHDELPPAGLDLSDALLSIAESLCRFGSYAEAEPLIGEALAIRKAKSPQSWQTHWLELLLGEVELASGNSTLPNRIWKMPTTN